MKFSYFILFLVGLIALFSCEKDSADEAYIVLKLEEYPSGEGMDSVFCVVVDQKVYYPKYGQFTKVDEIDEEDILFKGYSSSDGVFSRKIDLNDYPEDKPTFQIVVDLDHEKWVGNRQTGSVSIYQNGYNKIKLYKEMKYARKAETTFQFQNINCSGSNDSINLRYRILDFYDNNFFTDIISYSGCNITDTIQRNFLQGNYEFKWEVYKDQDTLYGDTLITLGNLKQHFVIEM